tara:strand:+ start:4756 stop:4998 length:243 start_codon:yes stop_codon:yes gene_type:complete
MIPIIIIKIVFDIEIFSNASGIKWKKAPPNRAPIESETRKIINLSRLFLDIRNVIAPESPNNPLIKVVKIIKNNMFAILD